MDSKKVPLTRQQFEVLCHDSEWKLFDIPSQAWNLIPGLPRLEDTFAVMGSADPYNPRLLNMIKRCVAGFDQLVNETNPKPGEPEGNAYHFVVQESGRDDYPYILHGPFRTGMRINHHFEVNEIEAYDSDKKHHNLLWN